MPILLPLLRLQRRRSHKIIHATRDKKHVRRLMANLLLHEAHSQSSSSYSTSAFVEFA